MKMLLALAVLFAVSCSHDPIKQSQRKPDSSRLILAADLQQWGPESFLLALRDNCCGAVMVKGGDISFWGAPEIAILEKFVNDETPAAPVVQPISSVSCHGARYASTVGREARHLILAIKKKTYPLALCSTYDLELSP
ncbi:hypothetical protein [Bdellovibrio sp.]|uniref:hypothetical protein n=1 Tax=Bdellovibrio sp. TaxID=28201 RepID=UPI0039E2269B